MQMNFYAVVATRGTLANSSADTNLNSQWYGGLDYNEAALHS